MLQGNIKDVNEKDHKGQTPLMLATCSVHKGKVWQPVITYLEDDYRV